MKDLITFRNGQEFAVSSSGKFSVTQDSDGVISILAVPEYFIQDESVAPLAVEDVTLANLDRINDDLQQGKVVIAGEEYAANLEEVDFIARCLILYMLDIKMEDNI